MRMQVNLCKSRRKRVSALMYPQGSAGVFPSKGCLQRGTCVVSFTLHSSGRDFSLQSPFLPLNRHPATLPSFVPFALNGVAMAGSIRTPLPLACWQRMSGPGECALAGRRGKASREFILLFLPFRVKPFSPLHS